jgi:hypothetical protein
MDDPSAHDWRCPDGFDGGAQLLCRRSQSVISDIKDVFGREEIQIVSFTMAQVKTSQRGTASEEEPLLVPEKRPEEIPLKLRQTIARAPTGLKPG